MSTMQPPVYRIAKWETVFERAESRKLKHLTWIAMPVGFTSHGYQSILDEFEHDAPAIYGAWCALVGVAAGCVHRGVLGSGRGIPLTASRIARMTGFDASLYELLFRWASRPDIAWLEVVGEDELEGITGEKPPISQGKPISGESPDDLPECRGNPPTTEQNSTEQDSTEQDSTEQGGSGADCAAAPADDGLRDWLVWWNTLRRNEPPLVPCGASVDEPSDAIRKAWKRVASSRELRGLVSQRDAIERELRDSSFARGARWLRPERFLGGKNREGEYIVRVLLEGGYRNDPKPGGRQLSLAGPGQQYDPNSEPEGF